jgi:hypothetical protein
MIKLLFAVMGLIAAALVAVAYLDFNPALLIFAILGFGIFMVGESGRPAMPPGGKPIHWGSGYGIYCRLRNIVLRADRQNAELVLTPCGIAASQSVISLMRGSAMAKKPSAATWP